MAQIHATRLAGMLVAGSIILAFRSMAAAAEPVFVLPQSLTHTLSPNGPNVISFLVASAQDVERPTVAIVQIRTPLGEMLPLDLFTIGQPPATISPSGSPFVLTLSDSSRFKASGDYTVTLRLTGTQKEVVQSQLATLTINVLQPVLDLARHQNATIRAYRWTPWSAAAIDETLKFEETGGRSNVSDLKISARDIYLKGTTDLVPASIDITSDTNGDGGAGLTLRAGGQRQIHLKVTGLDRAGTMTTSLLVASPTLGAPITLPLNIEVADRWPLPLLVITLGVALGAWVRYLSQVARPRETARFRRSLLAGQVARWRDRSRDPQQIQELDGIDDVLLRTEDRLQLGDVPAATTLLDQAESAIGEFRKGWEQRFRAVVLRLRETATRMDELLARIPTTETDDLARFETARQHIAVAQQALTAFDVPAAETRIASAAAVVESLNTLYPEQAARRGLAPSQTQSIAIEILEAVDDRVAGGELAFRVDDPGGDLVEGDRFAWDFGDGSGETTPSPEVRHRFLSGGAYRVRVAVVRVEQLVLSAGTSVDVLPRPIERLAEEQRAGLWRLTLGLTAVSVVLAVLTCMGLLFFGKSFGTPQQYVEAFLWGFGIDSSVKSIADLLKKV